MAAYFTSSQYNTYLPSEIAGDSDIADLATWAEWKVKNHYTRRVPDRRGTVAEYGDEIITGQENLSPADSDIRVYLLYYETDADDVDTTDAGEAAFLEAMRRAIAIQVVREYYQRQQNPTLVSHSRGERSWTYSSSFGREGLDSQVEAILSPYDIRPKTFVI